MAVRSIKKKINERREFITSYDLRKQNFLPIVEFILSRSQERRMTSVLREACHTSLIFLI